jgi:hypothetical protein
VVNLLRWGIHTPAGATPNTGGRPRRPEAVPQEGFRPLLRVPISSGVGTATVSGSGTATVAVGPSGTGTRWYPKKGDINTTTGAADASTCQIFIGPGTVSEDTLGAGQSYLGGGDTFGLSGEMLQPGDFVTAVWSGGQPGDTATLRITGDQVVMVY